jgi:uncharacterized membrane protein
MKRWLVISLALTAAAVVAVLLTWWGVFGELPARVPVHWDLHGQPNRWVPREELLPLLFLMPGVMLGMVGLGLLLPWLSPKQFEVEPFRRTYERIMVLVVALFGYIHAMSLAGHLRADFDLVRWLVGGIMLFFAFLGNVMGKVRRNFWMGVRTPWTLASPAVWERTHRVTAWLWTAGGLVLGVAVLAGLPLAWTFGPFLLMIFFPVFYSLYLYKRLQKEGKLGDGAEPAAPEAPA